MTIDKLISKAIAGDKLSLARLMSRVEDDRASAALVLAEVYPRTGHAKIVGVTGAPGTGKSTLVNSLALHYRALGLSVGIVAVDPTSSLSGGAFLGDRIRMRDLSGDPGVFIRSMASRGNMGGLAQATQDIVHILDAAGYDLVIIETVGAGQTEVDIAQVASTVVVVEAPGLGDDVQAIKAGLLEIADIVVVNKADRDGADSTASMLCAMLGLGQDAFSVSEDEKGIGGDGSGDGGSREPFWRVPVLRTVATSGEGVTEVAEMIEKHGEFLVTSGRLESWARERATAALQRVLSDELLSSYLGLEGEHSVKEAVEMIVARERDLYSASRFLLDRVKLSMID